MGAAKMRSVNMESKAIKSQCFLTFGLSFNLILTLGSLGFTCYSLHRLDSRVTTVEQNVLQIPLISFSVEWLLNQLLPNHIQVAHELETVRDKRAADKGSSCRKCRRDCPNSSGVSFFFVCSFIKYHLHKCIGIFWGKFEWLEHKPAC